MGKGLVDKLSQEFDIQAEWLGFEIHPETPPDGILLAERFPVAMFKQMYASLQQQGEAFGIRFEKLTLLSNSRLAMEAAEFARDCGIFEPWHQALFPAYFTECQDIGHIDVLINLANQIGLELEGLQDALKKHTYLPRLKNVTQTAHQLGIHVAPTFIVNDGFKIVGAQPLEFFRKAFTRAATDQL